MIREKETHGYAGVPVLLALLALMAGAVYLLIDAARAKDLLTTITMIVALVVFAFLLGGLFIVNPNETKVLQLFGKYAGTAKIPGLRWANPFLTKKRVSLRVRNFESTHLKVNDNEGNPIEIAAVVVWRVVETAEACFEVDDYENYVHVQSEAALRNLATS